MLNSTKARALAAVLVAGVAAAVGGVAVSHGGGSSSAASSAPGGAGMDGAPPGGRAGGFGFQSDMTAAASYLGLKTSQLQTRMRSGETLAAIATAQEKPKQGLVDAIVAAETKNLTAAQKARSLTTIESRVSRMVSSSGPPTRGPPPTPSS